MEIQHRACGASEIDFHTGEVYLEDKLEAAREQRLAKGKRSHETSLERKLYEELQKLREHCAQHCGHDIDTQSQTIKTAGTLLPWVRFSKGREEVVLPALFDPVWKSTSELGDDAMASGARNLISTQVR